MGMLFIPITTLSLSTLKGKQIGQGAAFTGMMRQLGGSFGIALITTFMSRRLIIHQADLLGRMSSTNLLTQLNYQGMVQAFVNKGMYASEASKMAFAGIGGRALKQAAILSYMD